MRWYEKYSPQSQKNKKHILFKISQDAYTRLWSRDSLIGNSCKQYYKYTAAMYSIL